MSFSSEDARQLAHATILAQLAEGVIVTDVVGTIVFVNEAAAEIHGVARLDVRPNAYADTYHLYREDGRPYPSEDLPLARAVRGETVVDARWRIRRPDNREVVAIGTAKPLRTANGRRVGAVLTMRDITAQTAAETSLRRSETALSAARKQLADGLAARAPVEPTEAVMPAGSASLFNASAKIKASLCDILSHARRSQEAASFTEGQAHLEHLTATAGALMALVDTLLDVAKPDGRMSRLAPGPA